MFFLIEIYFMKNNNPKVCVIMPVYNGEKTIKFALASLLVQ